MGVYIKDLSGYVVNNADDMDRIMTMGHKNRKDSHKAFIRDLSIRIHDRTVYTICQTPPHKIGF